MFIFSKGTIINIHQRTQHTAVNIETNGRILKTHSSLESNLSKILPVNCKFIRCSIST